MKIEVFRQEVGASLTDAKERIVAMTVNGIEEVATNEVAKKEGSSKPKVTLSFELSRSGLLQLNKADIKIEELVWVEEKPAKSSKKNKTNSTDSEAKGDETEKQEEEKKKEEEEEQKDDTDKGPESNKKLKKRPNVYPLGQIVRKYDGHATLTRD